MNTRHLRLEDLAGKKWRGYVRESTQAQADRGTPPERQRADIIRATTELGMTPAEPVWYERVGSGEAEDAPELARALADGKAGQYQVLVIFHSSRWARNRYEAITMKRAFAAAGIILYSTSQRLISGTYAGALTEGLYEVVDEHANAERRLFIAGGQRERQLSGRWVGRLPFGLRYVLVDFPDGSRRWDGRLEPDPETAPIVRGIFELAAAGTSPRSIAINLNLRGIRTVEGDPWSARSVGYILANPVYTGHVVRYRRPHARHYYPETDPTDGRREVGRAFAPLVDDELFSQVGQAIADRRLGGRGTGPGGYRPYPLSRVLRCGKCGYRMTGVFSAGRRYYRCAGRTKFDLCDAPITRADTIEGTFADWLSGYRLPDDWRAEIARTSVVALRSNEADRQAKLAERLGRLRKQHEWGDIGDDDYRARSTALRSEMGVMAKPAVASLEAVASAIGKLGRAWQSGPPEAKAALPPLILKAAEWRDGRATWVVKAELRPLLELCQPNLPTGARLYPPAAQYEVRYSA